jgi:uncharacterized membrane protein YjdF
MNSLSNNENAMKRFDSILRMIARLGFLMLLIYELLAWAGVIESSLSYTWRGLVVTLLAVWFFMEVISFWLKKKRGGPILGIVFLLPLLSIFVDALGDIHHWYVTYTWYDQVAHFTGGGSTVVLLWNIMFRVVREEVRLWQPWIVYQLAFGFTIFIGVMYEIEEFTEDVIFHSNRLGDGPDTVDDLLLNCLGALTYLAIVALVRKIRNRNTHVSQTNS